MAIDLNEIIPLGRSYTEYVRMFGLDEIDESVSILDCGGGPSSFNCQISKKGYSVISVDPIYGFSKIVLNEKLLKTIDYGFFWNDMSK